MAGACLDESGDVAAHHLVVDRLEVGAHFLQQVHLEPRVSAVFFLILIRAFPIAGTQGLMTLMI